MTAYLLPCAEWHEGDDAESVIDDGKGEDEEEENRMLTGSPRLVFKERTSGGFLVFI